MAHLLALVSVLISLVVLVRAAATNIPLEKKDPTPTSDRFNQATRTSPGSPPTAAHFPSVPQRPAADHADVSLESSSVPTAHEHQSSRLFSHFAQENYDSSPTYVHSWEAPWPKLLASPVVIYTNDRKYLTVTGEVRWEKEGREGPVFRCTSSPTDSEELFLEPFKVENKTVSPYRRGTVAITSSTNNSISLRDSLGGLLFHFEPEGGRYRIYFKTDGDSFGPPARCDGDTDTLFNVRAVASPDSISAFTVVDNDAVTTLNTSIQYATTICSGVPETIDYTGSRGDIYEVQVLGGAEPDVVLQAPLPGLSDRAYTATVKNGKFLTIFPYTRTLVTHQPYQVTLVEVTQKEEYSSILWAATMSYREKNVTRVLLGRSRLLHIDQLIPAKTSLLHQFPRESCMPIREIVKVDSIDADGKQHPLRKDNTKYSRFPQIQMDVGKQKQR